MPDILTATAITEGAASGPLNDSHQGAAQANTCTLTPAAAKTPFLQGFTVTGMGATGALGVLVTITGLAGTGTLNFIHAVPAGVGVPSEPLSREYFPPLAGIVGTPIVVTVPSFGAGNPQSAAEAHGFQV